MKIIITEEQYNELNKADDVYNNLTPYFRRRVNFIDIPKRIERNVSLFDSDWYKQMSMNYLVRLVVNHIVWETIPSEWGGSDDTRNLGDYNKIMFANIMDRYGEYIKKLIIKKLKS